jgi:hypothetical protein
MVLIPNITFSASAAALQADAYSGYRGPAPGACGLSLLVQSGVSGLRQRRELISSAKAQTVRRGLHPGLHHIYRYS